jgi:exopolysaccharide biosynthesis protein
MEKTKTIILSVLILVFLLGLFLGPYAWYNSVSFFGKYNELKKTGTKTTAIVDSKMEKRVFRVSNITVDIHYKDEKQNKVIDKDGIDINGSYFDELSIGQSVAILYNGDDVVIVDDYKSEHLPPIKKPYWGMIFTILSYGFIAWRVISTRRKNKK